MIIVLTMHSESALCVTGAQFVGGLTHVVGRVVGCGVLDGECGRTIRVGHLVPVSRCDLTTALIPEWTENRGDLQEELIKHVTIYHQMRHKWRRRFMSKWQNQENSQILKIYLC